MSASELDEVVTLLVRILGDPRAYGERLLQQVLLRCAESAPSVVQRRGRDGFKLADLVVPPEFEDEDHDRAPDGEARKDRSGGQPDHAGKGIYGTDPPGSVPHRADGDPVSGASTEIAVVLAAALGACDCWGLRGDCPTCRGKGSAGWIDPDVDLFHEYVSPAAARLSSLLDGDSGAVPETPVHRNGQTYLRQGAMS